MLIDQETIIENNNVGDPEYQVKIYSLLDNIRFYLGLKYNPLKYLQSNLSHDFDIGRINFFNKHIFLIKNPKLIEEILTKKAYIFDKAMKGVDSSTGTSLNTASGDKIRTKPHIAIPKLSSSNFNDYTSQIRTVINQEIKLLKLKKVEFDLHEVIEYIYLRIVFKVFFSEEFEESNRHVIQYIHTINKAMKQRSLSIFQTHKYLPSPANRQYQRYLNFVNQIMIDLIHRRQQHPYPPDDLLTLIVSPVERKTRSFKEIYNDIATLIPAAYETPAKATSYFLFNILTNPEIKSEVFKEISAQGNLDLLSLSDMTKLTYLTATLKETLRLFPPVWILTRKSNEETTLGDHIIPKGSIMLFSQYQMHRHPDYWNNPTKFDPTRFLEQDERTKFAYFPFSGGPSRCVGKQFAERLIPFIALRLLSELEITPLVEDIKPEPGITMAPAFGFPVKIQPRVRS